MSDQSNFSDKEIERHLRETTGRAKNVDYDKRALMQEIVTLAQRGEIEELERMLEELGLDLSPAQKATILKRAHDVRQNALRSR